MTPASAPAGARRQYAPAALVLAAFAVAGAAVVDDYGVSWDEARSRSYGITALRSVLGDGGPFTNQDLYAPARQPWEEYFGVVIEVPLLLAERGLGLTDSRAVHLSRHLLTHLLFLTGGLFCYLLACRLFGDRRLALFALLLFLLHPRLYAHSFFNSKDLPFLVLFMVALYLLERAFRRGAAAAFAACGAGVGVLVSLRFMGVMLFAAVAALRALDLLQARGGAARRRAAATTAAFVLAAAGTLYAVSPYLWGDPFAVAEAFATLVRVSQPVITLFQGELVRRPRIPPHFLPTWMAVTTPPATLLLCLIGAAAAVRRGIACPRSAIGNTGLRYALLLLACLTLPAAAVAALRSNVYHDWRHLYFTFAPACLLAVYGLRTLLAEAQRRSLRHGRLLRRGLYVLAGAALAGMAVDLVRLHPHQHAYFNFLVDRRTPERLRAQYQMLYWTTEYREGLEYLLERFPDSTLSVDSANPRLWLSRSILPAAARDRIVIADEAGTAADFFLAGNSRSAIDHRIFGRTQPPFGPVIHARRIYRNTVLAVTAVDLSLVDGATADRYRAAYRATLAGEPVLRSEFDLYLDGGTLTWVKEACRPEDTVHPFLVRAVPAAVDDLPAWLREEGWEPLGFRFGHYGVRFDGRCLIRRPLPDYPIQALHVGRWAPGAGSMLEATIELPAAGPWVSRYRRELAAIAAGERGAPAASAAPAGHPAFDLYLDPAGAVLTYHKEPCAAEDLRERFFLHLFPADAAELAADGGQYGFANRDFDFADHGVLLDGSCVALAPLPAWERGIARVRTGQFRSGQGQLWSAEFRAGD